MSENKSKEREELEKVIAELKKIQKGNISHEDLNAVISKIKNNKN